MSSVVYPRRLYFFGLLAYIFVIYGLRLITLWIEPESFVFSRFADLKFESILYSIPWVLIINLYLIMVGFLVPRKLILKRPNKKTIKMLFIWFYFACLAYPVIAYMLGQKMGAEDSEGAFDRIVFALFLSIIPLKLIAFSLALYTEDVKRAFIYVLIPYGAALFMFGHKGGVYLTLFMFLCILVARGISVMKMRFFIMGALAISLYPIIQLSSSIIRGDGLLDEAYLLNINISSSAFDYLFISLLSFSRRLSAVDQLSFYGDLEVDLFSPNGIFLFILRGIFSAGLIDYLFSYEGFGIGRVFAVSIGQPTYVLNSFDPSLVGTIVFSSQPLVNFSVFLIAHISVFILLLWLAKKGHWFYQYIFMYYLFTTTTLLLVGDYQSMGLVLRVVIIVSIFTSLTRSIRRDKVTSPSNV